jgi:ankyrin repeat protein
MSKLIEAVIKNNEVEVKRLLDGGQNPNVFKGCYYPLFLAVREGGFRKHLGNKKIVKLLIEAGADVNQINFKKDSRYWSWEFTALYQAVVNKDVEMIKILLEAGADYNLRIGHDRFSPLQFAIQQVDKNSLEVFFPFIKRDDLENSIV